MIVGLAGIGTDVSGLWRLPWCRRSVSRAKGSCRHRLGLGRRRLHLTYIFIGVVLQTIRFSWLIGIIMPTEGLGCVDISA